MVHKYFGNNQRILFSKTLKADLKTNTGKSNDTTNIDKDENLETNKEYVYEVVLINKQDSTFDVNFFSMNVEKQENLFAIQNYPRQGRIVTKILPGESYRIDLPITLPDNSPSKSLAINSPCKSLAINSPCNYHDIIIFADILRNDFSITNGKQAFSHLIGPNPTQPIDIEPNINLILVDDNINSLVVNDNEDNNRNSRDTNNDNRNKDKDNDKINNRNKESERESNKETNKCNDKSDRKTSTNIYK